jgi:hypothetical protein
MSWRLIGLFSSVNFSGYGFRFASLRFPQKGAAMAPRQIVHADVSLNLALAVKGAGAMPGTAVSTFEPG